MPLPLTLYVDPRSTCLVCNPETDFPCIVYFFIFFILSPRRLIKKVGRDVMGQRFCIYIFIVLFLIV